MIINDANADIINVYAQLRYDASAVVQWLHGMAHTQEEFLRQRDLFATDYSENKFVGTTHTRTHTHTHTCARTPAHSLIHTHSYPNADLVHESSPWSTLNNITICFIVIIIFEF